MMDIMAGIIKVGYFLTKKTETIDLETVVSLFITSLVSGRVSIFGVQ